MGGTVFDSTSIAGRFTSAAWHPTMPILLAAKEHGRIVTYTDEGEELAAEEQAFDYRPQDDRADLKPICVRWSPAAAQRKSGPPATTFDTEAGTFAVVAWSDGTIGVHIASTGRYLSVPVNETGRPIHLIHFAPVFAEADQDEAPTLLWVADEGGGVALLNLSPLNYAGNDVPLLVGAWQLPSTSKKILTILPISTERCLVLMGDSSLHLLQLSTVANPNDKRACLVRTLLTSKIGNTHTASICSLLSLNERNDKFAYLTDQCTLQPFSLTDADSLQTTMPMITLPAPSLASAAVMQGVVPKILNVRIADSVLFVSTGALLVGVDLTHHEEAVMFYPENVPDLADTGPYMSMQFHAFSNTLSVGTDKGRVLQWRMHEGGLQSENEDSNKPKLWRSWHPLSTIPVGGVFDDFAYYPHGRLFYVLKRGEIRILSEQPAAMHLSFPNPDPQRQEELSFSDYIACTQTDGTSVVIDAEQYGLKSIRSLTSKMKIRGVMIAGRHLILSGPKSVEIYDVDAQMPAKANNHKLLYSFALRKPPISIFVDRSEMPHAPSTSAASPSSASSFSSTLFLLYAYRCEAVHFSGTAQQVYKVTGAGQFAGDAFVAGACHHGALVLLGRKGALWRWDALSQRNGELEPTFGDIGSMGVATSLSLNADGSCAAVLTKDKHGAYDGVVHFYHFAMRSTIRYSLATQHTLPNLVKWDRCDPRCAIIQTERKADLISHDSTDDLLNNLEGASHSAVTDSKTSNRELSVVFILPGHDPLPHATFPIQAEADELLQVQAPFLFFRRAETALAASADAAPPSTRIFTAPLPDFKAVLLDDNRFQHDAALVKTILDFGVFAAQGNIDEAIRVVGKVQSATVWLHIAKMCVKMRRLDALPICFSRLNNARAALNYETAILEPEMEARVGLLAIELEMYDDAVHQFSQCQRWDLLNQLYQGRNMWEKAIEVAEAKDRINLKNTWYRYGKYLADSGDPQAAIKAFEKAGPCERQISRLLLKSPKTLQRYISMHPENGQLQKWWAQYAESQDLPTVALESYQRAGHYLGMVRVLCTLGEVAAAVETANHDVSGAAAYQMARFLESQNMPREAVQYYCKAKCASHAVRLAQAYQLHDALYEAALQAGDHLRIKTARYFEDTLKDSEHAIRLYWKSGRLLKALDLAVASRQFLIVRDIIAGLHSEERDHALLLKCADFFVSQRQFDQAVHMLLQHHLIDQALALCAKHRVFLTEDDIDAVPLPEESETAKRDLLKRLGDICMQQGHYQLASKKYTSAGAHAEALKALTKTGDREAVAFFAGVAGQRQKELLITAANFLQHPPSDKLNNEHYTGVLTAFFKKAKAYDTMAAFHYEQAQGLIGTSGDHAAALQKLNEAIEASRLAMAQQSLRTAATPSHRPTLQETWEADQTRLLEFLQWQTPGKGNAAGDVIAWCQQCLAQPLAGSLLRVGDVYALMVKTCAGAQQYDAALEALKQMEAVVPSVTPYLDTSYVQSIRDQAQ